MACIQMRKNVRKWKLYKRRCRTYHLCFFLSKTFLFHKFSFCFDIYCVCCYNFVINQLVIDFSNNISAADTKLEFPKDQLDGLKYSYTYTYSKTILLFISVSVIIVEFVFVIIHLGRISLTRQKMEKRMAQKLLL